MQRFNLDALCLPPKNIKKCPQKLLKIAPLNFFYVLACPKIEFPYNHKQDWLFRPNLLVLQKPRKKISTLSTLPCKNQF